MLISSLTTSFIPAFQTPMHGGGGRPLQSGYGRQRFASNPLHMELRACIEGLKTAAVMGCTDIIF